MKFSLKLLSVILVCLVIIATGCSAKKVFCGCPNERGFVGYK